MTGEVELPAAVGRPERLAALARQRILDTAPDPALDDIARIASSLCAAPVALVTLIDERRQWFKARVGVDMSGTPIEMAICSHALDQSGLLVIPDLSLDPRTRANPLVTDAPHIRFYAGAPMRTVDGETIGTLCVIDVVPRPEGLTPAQAEGLAALGRQAIMLIELHRRISEGDAAIRAQKAAAADALASDRRSRAAQAAGRIGTFELDVATGRVVVSEEFCRLYGLPVSATYRIEEIEARVEPADRAIPSNVATRRDGNAILDVEYRIRRGDDGRLRWISRRASFERDGDDRTVRMFGTVHDVTERRQADERNAVLLTLGERLRQLETREAVIDMAGEVLVRTLSAGRAGYATIDEAAGLVAIERDVTAGDVASIAGSYPRGIFAATLAALAGGEAMVVANIAHDPALAGDRDSYGAIATVAQIKVPLLLRGTLMAFMFVHDQQPRMWNPLEVDFVVGVADRVYATLAGLRAEADRRLLNEELSHRLKNTLTMVHALASQTFKRGDDRALVDVFQRRLTALSTAHDVLLQQDWASARIASIVASVTGKLQNGRIDAAGPDLTLGPRAVLAFSLLLHELTTNAIKYGALSNDEGRVTLGWRVAGDGDTAEIVIDWHERGGPPARQPTATGFGSRLIAMGLMGAGGVVTRYEPAGLSAEFRAPLQAARNA